MTLARAEKAAGGRQALARRMAGISTKGKLPPPGSDERRHYQSAMRAIQRNEAIGKVNPKTGKPMQARAGAAVSATGETIAAENRALRRPTITVRGLTVTTTINGDKRYQRRRQLGDVTMTRAQFRALKRLDADEDDELLAQLVANVSDRIEDLSLAPGVQTLDVSDVSFSSID